MQVSDSKKAARYYRIQVNDEPGVIAKISSLFADRNISIEALIQHEAKAKANLESIPVVIISGEITDNEAFKLKNELEDLPEVTPGVKKFRIHLGKK